MLRAERQSARMSKITNHGLTRSGTGCVKVCVKGLTNIQRQDGITNKKRKKIECYEANINDPCNIILTSHWNRM